MAEYTGVLPGPEKPNSTAINLSSTEKPRYRIISSATAAHCPYRYTALIEIIRDTRDVLPTEEASLTHWVISLWGPEAALKLTCRAIRISPA